MPTKSAKRLLYPRLVLVISLLFLVWAADLASTRLITKPELSVFRYINNWPDSLRSLFLVATQFGSVWMLFAITLLSIWKRRHRLALRLFVSGAGAFFATETLKYIVNRPRPAFLISQINLRERMVADYGFPSSHTAMAATIGLLLLLFLPKKWRWLPILGIILVGLSRIYLGVHAPLDIIGGLAVGVTVVCLSVMIRNKLQFVTKITHLKLTD